ncbi:helix-turn-helix transcriptional regulator [Allonocardiopsis opalescens]|uniref:DNA-binding NarL/FixJ family response regulator n=1 Tax=Allonocardiopsis opalescens TaxID=1144618 RepID=A0A2T0QB29_9ACTN|nr:response regulator transcription factor [Allonocardiopsis opalescens]PRY01025.1 DNA-binding NarL/FixJ family response regulator [Allonocardiopsis opalescens]
MSMPSLALAPREIVLALGNELQRYGIERMLQSLGDVGALRVCDNLADAVGTVGDDSETVLIVALREIDQLAAAHLRAAADNGAKILVLVDEDSTDLSRFADVSGSGFLSADELNTRTLSDALARVRAGEVPMSARLARDLMAKASQSGGRTAVARPAVRLTPREQQVLVLLVDGLSNKQIARRLGISVHGAKRLVANILAKLDCPTRTFAVAKALREGIYEQYVREM